MRHILSIALALVLVSCAKETNITQAEAPNVSHQPEFEIWRQDREARLKKDDSWLTLVGLHWLQDGNNRIGSDRKNDIVMTDKAPARAGAIIVEKGKVFLKPDLNAGLMIDGRPVTGMTALLVDTDEKGPTTVEAGSLRFYVIERDDKYALRVKDRESEARTSFVGLEYFPYDPKWRLEAKLEPYKPPREIPITNIVGQTTNVPAPGALVFTIDGKTFRVDPIIEEGEKDYFIIFKDETSAKETYGAGRYLYAAPAGPDGKVIVDFNKAYNPPCVFTPFATCPLPPAQNRLPIRIEAGEKMYKGKHA